MLSTLYHRRLTRNFTWFEFRTTVTITSNAAKVITAGTKYILGTVFGYTTDATEIDGFSADGSTHVAISSNGSTTGGVIGDCYTLVYDGTQWLVEGNIFCGTATPCDSLRNIVIN